MNVIGQIIGFIYLGIFIFSFQFKDKKKLIGLRILSKIFVGIHYIFIGALTGSIFQFLEIFPNYCAYKYENNKNKIIMIMFFIIIYIFVGLYTYKTKYDILPILGSILSIIAISKKGTKSIRTWQFIISPMFLTYNIMNISYAGIITEILVLASCISGTIRLDKRTT